MRISRCRISGLFGEFDHDFRLNRSSRITILHGPNGVGKTTALRLINDLFAQNFPGVLKVPFDKLSLWTTGPRGRITVDRTDRAGRWSLQLSYKEATQETRTFKFEERTDDNIRQYRVNVDLSNYVESLERVSVSNWYDSSQGDTLSTEEALYRYRDRFPPFLVEKLYKKTEVWVQELLSSLTIHFIQTQRLTIPKRPPRPSRHSGQSTTSSVEMYAEELAETLQKHLRESGSKAASLDRTFPHRVLGAEMPARSDDEIIRHDLEQQSQYRSRLMAAGLIESEVEVAVEKRALENYERKVLRYYLDDVQQKFAVFADLLPKIELFMDIINSRFLHKRVSIDRFKGLVFTSSSGADTIPLGLLSSGEQHEIVLAYELLFKVGTDSLILIDEPEISLHVSWQHSFLEDLLRISALADLDFVLATHSPSIIHQRQDLMVALGARE